MAPASPTVTFTGELRGFGNNTGIEVSPDVLESLGAGRRPAVSVDLNGYRFRSAIGAMSGRALISVSAAIRKETGLKAGDAITVTLEVAAAPREVVVPDDFAKAMAATPSVRAFFDGLSNSVQRFHIDTITAAKTDETRARRIAKSVELFRAGKAR